MAWFGFPKKRSGASPSAPPRKRTPSPRKGAPRGAVPTRRARAQAAASAPASWSAIAGTAFQPLLRWSWPTIKWADLGHRLLPMVAVLLVAGLALSGWRLLAHVGAVPVSRVLFTGKLEHVDRAELVERVQPLLAGEGFLTADIDRVRAVVLEMPWVAKASVRRHWPDELIVDVQEQQPIARWGSDGLLSSNGQVFRPDSVAIGATLPALFGPDAMAAEVVARYADLNEMLAVQGLGLMSLGTDQRGSWRLELTNGVTLKLGTDDVLKKMRRFINAYQFDLHEQIEKIDNIDLRYSNGLAVGWKALQQAHNEHANAAAHRGVTGNG